MKMKISIDEQNGFVIVHEAFDSNDYRYSIKSLHDMAILHRLDVYYIENIYMAVDNYVRNLTPFENGLYVFLGYEHDQLHFVSVIDGNVYTVPAAMHGLRFYFNPNLNSIVRDEAYFNMFYVQTEVPDPGYSEYTWLRKCALNFGKDVKKV